MSYNERIEDLRLSLRLLNRINSIEIPKVSKIQVAVYEEVIKDLLDSTGFKLNCYCEKYFIEADSRLYRIEKTDTIEEVETATGYAIVINKETEKCTVKCGFWNQGTADFDTFQEAIEYVKQKELEVLKEGGSLDI